MVAVVYLAAGRCRLCDATRSNPDSCRSTAGSRRRRVRSYCRLDPTPVAPWCSWTTPWFRTTSLPVRAGEDVATARGEARFKTDERRERANAKREWASRPEAPDLTRLRIHVYESFLPPPLYQKTNKKNTYTPHFKQNIFAWLLFLVGDDRHRCG